MRTKSYTLVHTKENNNVRAPVEPLHRITLQPTLPGCCLLDGVLWATLHASGPGQASASSHVHVHRYPQDDSQLLPPSCSSVALPKHAT